MNSANNPYSTSTLTTAPSLDMNVQNQYMRHKQEEQGHMAGKKMPHPSESLEEVVSQLFPILISIKNIIKNTENEPKVDKESVKEIYDIIDHLNQTITFDLSKAIDKLYL